MRVNENSLAYWFPKIVDIGIPVPRTIILPVDQDAMLGALYGHRLPTDYERILKETAGNIGYPLFLRTDLQSGKHGWKNTCYVESEGSLLSNIGGVIEENMLGACCFGPMFEALVFREFLALETGFLAFYGDLPVNKERRYFVNNGVIVCRHPYWPAEAIRGHSKDSEWSLKLDSLNREDANEISLLGDYALRVSDRLSGYWSVDFAKALNGSWYLIDMALGCESYHWPGCVEGAGPKPSEDVRREQ